MADKNQILLNLGVQVDSNQLKSVVNEAQKNIQKNINKVTLETEVTVNEQKVQAAVNQINNLVNGINVKGAIKELKRPLQELELELEILDNTMKGKDYSEVDNTLKRIGQIVDRMVDSQKAYNKELHNTEVKEKRKAAEQQKAAKAAQEAADIAKKANKDIKKTTDDIINAEKKKAKTVADTNKELEKQAQLQNNLKNDIPKGKTNKGNSSKGVNIKSSQLSDVFTGYKINLSDLEEQIKKAQVYKPMLQQLGMQGIDGDTRAARENVYKAVQAIEDMGKELQVDTGKVFKDTNEIFD